MENYSEELSGFVRIHRKNLNMTQGELAFRAGVGLRFVRDMEQGKQTLRLDKVNEVMALFGYEMKPQKLPRDEGE